MPTSDRHHLPGRAGRAGARLKAPAAVALAALAAIAVPRVARAGSASGAQTAAPAAAAARPSRSASTADATIADYFRAFKNAGLLDVESGTKASLAAELARGERLLRSKAWLEAAVALYSIVESPKYTVFNDFVEYQNSEYDLAIALSNAGAYQSALHYLTRIIARGPKSMYFAPANRRAVDIALKTRDFSGVLHMLQQIKLSEPLAPSVLGERTYLKARIAYKAGHLDEAEQELRTISRRSRLYSSALYLRGVMLARQGRFRRAAEALCEIVDTPADDKYTFVIDGRYFKIKDLARLGLGRIAHENGEYDDAYYHYFQIPQDSDKLPDALFEASWSMYQKRELGTARDLIHQFLRTFPGSPLVPEARLLAGYIELADCKFDAAQKQFDGLIAALTPVVAEIDKARHDPALRQKLFGLAITRWRSHEPRAHQSAAPASPMQQMLALLELDPDYVRLHDAMAGLRRAAGDAPHVTQRWRELADRLRHVKVRKLAKEPTMAQEDNARLGGLLRDTDRLSDQVARERADLLRGERSGMLPAAAAKAEHARLDKLDSDIEAFRARVSAAVDRADAAAAESAPGVGPLVATDIRRSRHLEKASKALMTRLRGAADALAARSIDKLYTETRRVLDKARLGRIDTVIGQKEKLEIQVQDLAAGRYPAELHGRLWEDGRIGEDEEYWPPEGEYWADEYKGWE